MSDTQTCGRQYLPLCSIPARMSRDGWAGPNAHIYLPFDGIHFFSGAQWAFPNTTVPQDNKMYIGGVTLPNTFHKQCGAC